MLGDVEPNEPERAVLAHPGEQVRDLPEPGQRRDPPRPRTAALARPVKARTWAMVLPKMLKKVSEG